MFASENSVYSDKQAVTASAFSTNVVYEPTNVGRGCPVTLLVQVTTAFTSASTSSTLNVLLLSSDTSPTTNVTKSVANTNLQSGAIPIAKLVPGYQFNIDYYPQSSSRYTQIYYEVGTGPFTAGNITAETVMARQNEGIIKG